MQKVQGGLTEAEKRDNVIRLVFGGDAERFEELVRVVGDEIPEDTGVVLRGSAVTGQRWKDGAAFDADGPGTSDLDLTLVGDQVIGLFTVTGFFVPGVHSRPLSNEDPGIAPDLVGNTFPAWDPHVRLDYLFIPGGFIANVRRCDVKARPEAKDASDHLPLCAELDV